MDAYDASTVRVLVVDHTAPVASVRRRWARVARESNIELTLLSPHAWPENSQWNVFQPEEGTPYNVVVGRVTFPGREVRSIYLNGIVRAMRESRPDVIVLMEESFSAFTVQVLALRKLFAPRARIAFYACWILSYDLLWYRPMGFFRWLNRRLLPRLDAAMCINDQATRALENEGFRGARTNFFGVDESVFTRIPKAEARALTSIPQQDYTLLYAGRLLEMKGVDDLIDAFELTAKARPEASLRLIILGSGDHANAIKERASSTSVGDRIEIRGSVANEAIRQYMCAADVFVLPSRAAWCEQFGRVIAEAMLVETPVIGSTSGEIPSVIGDGGFIYEADDVDALVNTLARVIDEPREVERRVAVGRSRALTEFSVDAFVRRTIDLIGDLAGRPVRRQPVRFDDARVPSEVNSHLISS